MAKNAILVLLTLSTFLTSCSSSKQFVPERNIEIEKMDRNNYSITDQVASEAKATTFWLLFIPFGGKSKDKLFTTAYNEAVRKVPNCDGIITPRVEYQKQVIPLIIFSLVNRKVVVTGRGYKIKTDSEIKEGKN
jgi:hypothetical protein